MNSSDGAAGMSGGVIHTAITGGKDRLIESAHVVAGVRYVCFTDDPLLESDARNLRPISWRHADPARAAKHPKVLPHRYLKNHAWSL